MNNKELLAFAIRIASKAHVHQFDKSGSPYILHCLWVMNKVRHLGEEYMIVAVLHDLLEDTDWTTNKLVEYFPLFIVNTLELLNCKGKDYDSYIKQIATNEIARQVKLRDLEHNSKITRLKGLTKKDHDRIEKYHRSYTYLKSI